jgi:molybdate transport system substrate-binding protein
MVAGLLLGSCADDASTVAMVPASLAGVTVEIDAALGMETDWIIAGSSRLVRQLADGAEADLLITADAETMNDAITQGIVEGDPTVIAGNRLVLAVAPGNPGEVSGLDDLRDPGLLIGVCAAEVPCGRLAAEARSTLDLDLAVDTEEPNVRALALKIASGELDAGLVYATDATDLGLETVADEELAAFANDYLALPLDAETSSILTYLRSEAGRAFLVDQGFTVP